MSTEKRATLIGICSILLWGLLALLTTLAGAIPPFQLLAMTFSIAFLMMLGKWLVMGEPILHYLKQPPLAWGIGVGGLFGYHLFYFIALSHAPAVEASLIAYLWPLLLVVLSSFLPGEGVKAKHLVGCAIAMAGCWLLLGGESATFTSQYMTGYLAALACAFIWSSYSVAGRLVKHVPTNAVGWFCCVTALLGWGCHGLFETTVLPADLTPWLGVLGLGLGPVGIAFFTWDYGVKHGDLQMLGVLAYSTPLISTLLLIGFGETEFSTRILMACLMIVGAALMATFGFSGWRQAQGSVKK